MAKQYSSGSARKGRETAGRQQESTTGAVATDALRPKILRFAAQLLESGYESMARMRAAESGMDALAQVEVTTAVSVATESLADAPTVEAIEQAAANLEAGLLADVADSRDWPLLVLLLAVVYYGVSATLVAVEDPESGPAVGQATESLALALLVVAAYAGSQS